MNSEASHMSINAQDQSALIVVVDDEPMVGELVQTIFSLEGLDSKVYQDPQVALHELKQWSGPPALLLTDFRMPGMNGMELIQGAKHRFPELKTVLFSGNVDETIQSQYPLPADAFIRKPFYPHLLLETVRKVLKNGDKGSGTV
jgi:two-component system C4-dicarboxylate transport response regulator DctD